MSLITTHNFGQFWSVSWTTTHHFGVPVRFPRLTIPGVRLHVRRQHSQFWPILTRFVDYYSPFWGPRVISTINEPLSAFTCRSSIILGLSSSGLIHGLLLTILGSQNAFHGCRTPRCAFVSVINTHSLGRFWPVSWTISHCFGVPERIPRLRNPGCVYVSVINTHCFG